MKQFKKTLFSTALILTLLLSSTLISNAAEMQPDISYDLTKGGTQVFYLEDSNGEEIIITVEEIEGTARIANGSYKVSYDYPNKWEAGFTVDISSNKITRAYSAFHTAIVGSITNATLTRNSNTKATYKFTHKTGLIGTTSGVVATISGTSLNVSKL